MNGCAAEAKTQKHIDYPENRAYEMRLLTFLFLTSYFYWIERSRKTQKSLNICVPGDNATNQTLLYSNSKFMRLSYIETKFRHQISEGKEEKERAREKNVHWSMTSEKDRTGSKRDRLSAAFINTECYDNNMIHWHLVEYLGVMPFSL